MQSAPARSSKDRYKRDYPWIDNFEEVTDPTTIAALNGEALNELCQCDFANFDLYPAEYITDEIVQFRLYPRNGGLVLVEPDASLLRYPIRNPTTAALADTALRSYHLVGINAAGEAVDRWRFWDCLHYQRTGAETVILDGGRWFVVDTDFASGIDNFIRGLPSSKIRWPAAIRGEAEDSYLARVANMRNFGLLDRRLIYLDGRSGIEPCDLFGRRGQIIHVKRRKGGSAPLSHLFGQALVSGECLVGEPDYQRKFRFRLSQSNVPSLRSLLSQPFVPRDHPIILALITGPAQSHDPAGTLPFFSKVFLRQCVRRLQNMGFRVFVDGIETHDPLLQPTTAAAP